MPWALVLLALAAAQSDEEQIMGEARDAVELFCPVDFEPLNYAQALQDLLGKSGPGTRELGEQCGERQLHLQHHS